MERRSFSSNPKGARANRPPEVLIELRPSTIHKVGVGVFAVVDLRNGQLVAPGIAEDDYESLMPWGVLQDCSPETKEKVRAFCVGTPEGFLPPPNMDFNKLSIDWYFNHSCEGNLGFDERGDFVAKRNIRKGEELAYDYGLAESNPQFRMLCTCGTATCRRIITGDDWKNEEFRRVNAEFMLPALRRLAVSVG